MQDENIIKLFLDRNEQAITEAERKYGVLCRSITKNLLGDSRDAEECANDTFHTAWRQIPPDLPQNLAAYLGRIVRNIAISRFREINAAKRGRGLSVLLSELEECIPSAYSVEGVVDTAETERILAEWLRTLNSNDRVLFVRRYWYGDSVKGLAISNRSTPTKISQRLFQLRKLLKKELAKKGVFI